MKIVIKIGTQSIISENGSLLNDIIDSIVEQIAKIHKQGHKIILVSSGAVACGRGMMKKYLNKSYDKISITDKQLLASVGQHELMNSYSKFFLNHNLLVSQLLLTKQNFYTRKYYLNIASLINTILNNENIIPIINENDSIALENSMFTDNDELAGLIAAQIGADKLIILSHVSGIYTSNPDISESQLIDIINPNEGWPKISTVKSKLGRGGMASKLNNAKKTSKLGIMTHIALINQENVIERIIAGEYIGTTILANHVKSSIKRWIAYGEPKGAIHINNNLYQLLIENTKAISILPIGIEKYKGQFTKGDIIEIIAPNNDVIGIGVAKYDVIKLSEFLYHKDKPALIHYDYLYIF